MPRRKNTRGDNVDETRVPPPLDEGRPKRARKPSWKALEDASGSSVEAILPSYVSSGSSLRSLSGGSGEENDVARIVPDAAGMLGQKQGSGGSFCPSKQGSNKLDRRERAGQDGAAPSSLKDSMTNVNVQLAGGAGGTSTKEATQRGIAQLHEYYNGHQQFFMEHMSNMMSKMTAKAQEMVINGDNLASIKMQEALHAVSTANAIIWRASSVAPGAIPDAPSAPVGTTAEALEESHGGRLSTLEAAAAMLCSPPVAVADGLGAGWIQRGAPKVGALPFRDPLDK